MPPRQARVETRRVRDLKPHACWAELYGDLTPVRRDVFDEDVATRGVQSRPEILPDNTVISGWLRKNSTGRNGQQDIEVVVRYDLAGQSPERIEHDMLADELNRRHRTPLGLARLIYRMCELEAQLLMPEGGWLAAVKAAAKDKIAAYLGITLKSVNLYLKAIEAPKVVRDACDRKEVTLTKTGSVGQLSDETKSEISRLIRGGAPPAQVVDRFLQPTRDRTSGFARLRRLAKACRYHVPHVRSHFRTLTPEQIRIYRRELEAAQRLLQRLLEKAS